MLDHAARWAVATRRSRLPDDRLHHAKRAVVDWFAAVVPGAGMAPARTLTAALVDGSEGGRATLLPGGPTAPMRTAALINATAAHSAEVDDIFRDGVYHPGAPTIAAALAVAQERGYDGDVFLRAVVVGYELSTRISARIQPAHYRYWHTTGTVGTLGAAAAVASLLDVDEDAFAHAVTTSTTMAAGLQQAFRSDAMSKPLHAGHAADAGTLAALAAAKGFTGVPSILDGEAGFGAAMSDAPSWDGIFEDLDEVANVARITFKNHTCCGHTFAAIDAALELRDVIGTDLDRISRIDVETYAAALRVAGIAAPRTGYEAQFSLAYTVVAALRLGSVRLAAFDDDNLHDPEITSVLERVHLTVDDELDAAFPRQRGARVRIELTDGTRHVSFRPTRRGDPDLPLTDEELDAKFRELVAPTLGKEATDELAQVLWHLEKQPDLTSLLPTRGW